MFIPALELQDNKDEMFRSEITWKIIAFLVETLDWEARILKVVIQNVLQVLLRLTIYKST